MRAGAAPPCASVVRVSQPAGRTAPDHPLRGPAPRGLAADWAKLGVPCDQSIPAGQLCLAVCCAPGSAHVHQGPCRGQLGLLPREWPFPEPGGAFPIIWNPGWAGRVGGGRRESRETQRRPALSRASRQGACQQAAPPHLGRQGSLPTPPSLAHPALSRADTAERGGILPGAATLPFPPGSLSTRPLWPPLCPRVQLWAGGGL